jgi:hypothetical protein
MGLIELKRSNMIRCPFHKHGTGQHTTVCPTRIMTKTKSFANRAEESSQPKLPPQIANVIAEKNTIMYFWRRELSCWWGLRGNQLLALAQ